MMDKQPTIFIKIRDNLTVESKPGQFDIAFVGDGLREVFSLKQRGFRAAAHKDLEPL